MKCYKCGSINITLKDRGKDVFYFCEDCMSELNKDQLMTIPQKTIEYFGVKCRIKYNGKLSRENYAILTDDLGSREADHMRSKLKMIEMYPEVAEFYPQITTIPNERYKSISKYTTKYVNKHYKDCMANYDLNIKYFKSLNKDDFNDNLNLFVNKYRFKEVYDLSTLKEITGIYIMVLDEYNVLYIGQAADICKRIKQHWSNLKEFDRLVFGSVERSILSIDSFYAKDTTRIFYKQYSYLSLEKMENKFVQEFNNRFLLNRINGGLNTDSLNDNFYSTLHSNAIQKDFKSE